MATVQPRSMDAAGANAANCPPPRMAPRRHCTTLFALIASLQARHGADTAAADAAVLRLLREQRVTFCHTTSGREVAAMCEAC